jgi:hypothetical protein
MQTSAKIPSGSRGVVLGVMKSLGRVRIAFTDATQDFLLGLIDSVREEAFKKATNRIALTMDIISNLISCDKDESKRWEGEKTKKYRLFAQAHISHQLKHCRYPNLLLSCFRLLCNDYLRLAKQQCKYLLSYSKLQPDTEYLRLTVGEIVGSSQGLLLPLSCISEIVSVYVTMLQSLEKIVPASLSGKAGISHLFSSEPDDVVSAGIGGDTQGQDSRHRVVG